MTSPYLSTRLRLLHLSMLALLSACDAEDDSSGAADDPGSSWRATSEACGDPDAFAPPDLGTACDGRRMVALIKPPAKPVLPGPAKPVFPTPAQPVFPGPAQSVFPGPTLPNNPTLSVPPCPGGSQISTPTGVWNVSPVFAGNVPVLNRFCLYEWVPAQADSMEEPDHGALPTNVLAMQSDCDWVFPQNNALADPSASTLTDTFRAHAGRMTEPDGHLAAAGAEVTVAVLDTARVAGIEARSPHGEAMADVIEDLACGDLPSSCPRTVTTTLALPRYYDDLGVPATDITGGGHFGGQVDLARAIDSAVNDWLAARQSDDAQRLVLNLSLGWDPHFGDIALGGGPSAHMNMLLNFGNQVDVPVRTQAVHAALVRASCEGALIVVSAGNQPLGGCEHGALNPGAWERLAAPTVSQCKDLGFGPTPYDEEWRTQPPASFPYTPLVHAVGAVGHDELPIAMTREGSMPRVAAPGYHAVAEIDQPSAAHEAFTGTSVSAAVASAAAAAVWSQHPHLSAPEVMAQVHASGVDLATPQSSAVNLMGQPSAPVQRISLCGAVRSACDDLTPSPACASIACDDTTVNAWDTSQVLQGYAGMATPLSVSFDPNTETCVDACGKDVETAQPSAGVFAEDLARPWTIPQPEYPFCDVCQIDDEDFMASLNSVYDKPYISIQNVSLTLYYAGYSAPSVFHLGSLPLNSSSIQTVTNPSFAMNSSGQPRTTIRAVVTATMTRQYGPVSRNFTVSNAVLVAPPGPI